VVLRRNGALPASFSLVSQAWTPFAAGCIFKDLPMRPFEIAACTWHGTIMILEVQRNEHGA